MSKRHGFSLTELAVVVAVIAATAAVAVPRYGQAVSRYRVKLAAQRIASDLEVARSEARAGGEPITVRFTAASSRYEIEDLSLSPQAGSDYIVNLGEPPYRVRIASVDFQGDTEVTFNAYGVPTAGGQVTVASGGHQWHVQLRAETGEAIVP